MINFNSSAPHHHQMRNGIVLPLLSVSLLWLLFFEAGVSALPLGVLNTGVLSPPLLLTVDEGVRVRVDEAGVRRKLLFTEEAASRFGVEVLFGVRAA